MSLITPRQDVPFARSPRQQPYAQRIRLEHARITHRPDIRIVDVANSQERILGLYPHLRGSRTTPDGLVEILKFFRFDIRLALCLLTLPNAKDFTCDVAIERCRSGYLQVTEICGEAVYFNAHDPETFPPRAMTAQPSFSTNPAPHLRIRRTRPLPKPQNCRILQRPKPTP